MRPPNRPLRRVLGFLLAVGASACSEATAIGNEGELSLEELGLVISLTTAPGLSGTMACPDGGAVRRTTQFQAEEGDITTLRLDGASEYHGCMVRSDDRLLTVSGIGRFTSVHSYLRTTMPPRLLTMESHQEGEQRILGAGLDRLCTHDLRTVYDGETARYRLTGTACGRSIELTYQ